MFRNGTSSLNKRIVRPCRSAKRRQTVRWCNLGRWIQVDSETSTAMDALKRHLGNDRSDDARVGRALVREQPAVRFGL